MNEVLVWGRLGCEAGKFLQRKLLPHNQHLTFNDVKSTNCKHHFWILPPTMIPLSAHISLRSSTKRSASRLCCSTCKRRESSDRFVVADFGCWLWNFDLCNCRHLIGWQIWSLEIWTRAVWHYQAAVSMGFSPHPKKFSNQFWKGSLQKTSSWLKINATSFFSPKKKTSQSPSSSEFPSWRRRFSQQWPSCVVCVHWLVPTDHLLQTSSWAPLAS